jgi:hypothetical protein
MYQSHQSVTVARDSRYDESVKTEASNYDGAAAAIAASHPTFLPATLDAQLRSIPSCIMHEYNADISIGDAVVTASSAREHLAASTPALPSLILPIRSLDFFVR